MDYGIIYVILRLYKKNIISSDFISLFKPGLFKDRSCASARSEIIGKETNHIDIMYAQADKHIFNVGLKIT